MLNNRKMKTKIFITASLLLIQALSFGQEQNTKTKGTNDSTQKTAVAEQVNTDENSTSNMAVKAGEFISEWMVPSSELKFNDLPYAYDALEPVIDKKTVEIHYDKHHRGYYTNFINAIKGTELEKMPITRIFSNITSHPDAVRNNAGGFFNHVLYWQNMSPDGGGEPTGELASAINKAFGNYKTFVEKFSEAAKARFGSGWAWLAIDLNSGELFITSTPNQDNPLMNNSERRGIPILGLDVWEHAYYLNYQNKRADYVTAFWTKVNWPDVAEKYNGYKDMREELKK